MIILIEDAGAQTVKFIARSLETGAATAVFTDEQENTDYSYSVTLQTDRYYTYFSKALPDLVDDRHYMLSVTYGATEIFRGKVFCTDQTPASYTINNSQFTQRTTTNEYILNE